MKMINQNGNLDFCVYIGLFHFRSRAKGHVIDRFPHAHSFARDSRPSVSFAHYKIWMIGPTFNFILMTHNDARIKEALLRRPQPVHTAKPECPKNIYFFCRPKKNILFASLCKRRLGSLVGAKNRRFKKNIKKKCCQKRWRG